MSQGIRSPVAMLRGYYCTTSAVVRFGANVALSTAAPNTSDIHSTETTSSCTKNQQSFAVPPKTDSMVANSKHNNLLFVDQYRSLVTDHAIKRSQLRQMVYFVNKSRNRGYTVPKQISSDDMLTLLGKPSFARRRRFMAYLRYKEEKAERKLNPNSLPCNTKPLPRTKITTDILADYGLYLNSIMIRIVDKSMHRFFEERLVANMPFAQKLALDFGYDYIMSDRESRKAAADVKALYSYNRSCSDPFNLIFCSFAELENNDFQGQSSTSSCNLLEKLINNRSITFPCEYTSRCVTEMFPREQIVYLSPQGEDELETLDDDKVYVLGVLVDKEYQPGLSLKRARQLGVRSARFPARVRLLWEQEEKPLHVVHCLKVLQDIKSGKDWQYAMSKISSNFVVDIDTEDS
ncbi:mitochondrial ribonuclease P protein 1-like [Varroa jacobsoni]|uniref:mitochondrial ribonuclease P protein 1-like n=1 Tax=Varroa jacobsoni TaxID=62625 RepID=UPI000BF96DB4|nr:mitochondrial ribonuclease P protein 1-like [Varroa jacobsoni]